MLLYFEKKLMVFLLAMFLYTLGVKAVAVYQYKKRKMCCKCIFSYPSDRVARSMSRKCITVSRMTLYLMSVG